MNNATTTTTPVNQVDDLIRRVADEAGLEVSEQLASVPNTSLEAEASAASTTVNDPLSRRLAALRD